MVDDKVGQRIRDVYHKAIKKSEDGAIFMLEYNFNLWEKLTEHEIRQKIDIKERQKLPKIGVKSELQYFYLFIFVSLVIYCIFTLLTYVKKHGSKSQRLHVIHMQLTPETPHIRLTPKINHTFHI